MYFFRRSGVAFCAALFSPVAVMADNLGDSADNSVQAQTITVEGRRDQPLTARDAEAARQELSQTAGAVHVIDSDSYRDSSARTLKDVLDYSAGVFVQPKWGEDARLSIRGSGLSRNFHLRGVQLMIDGIPINSADGSGDFQEIDPTAFAYSEVYKGANALQYGSNSLGGALNFVSRTGYDADAFSGRIDGGSFGMRRAQVSSGARSGKVDGHLSASYLSFDGFRDHADGNSLRASGNVGLRISRNVETRFYLTGADIEQRIPGTLTREEVLSNPEQASAGNVARGYARDIQSWRVANKTTLQFSNHRVELGVYAVEKQLIHPIFRYLDFDYQDIGGFARAVFDQTLFGLPNRLTIGAGLLGGEVDAQQFENLPGGEAGSLQTASHDESRNFNVYIEEQLEVVKGLRLIAGMQFLDASRDRSDRFEDDTDSSGRNDYDLSSPKFGVLWQASSTSQIFANISRSAEAPTFGELNFTNDVLSNTRAQRATTLEIGSRGNRGALKWDLAVYRAELRDEFQFFDLGDGRSSVTNADETVHQGVEAVIDWQLAHNAMNNGDALSWKLAYTFNDFYFDDDAQWGSNELPGAPRHFIRSELKYALGSWYVSPNVEWVPRGYDVDNANSVQTRHYAIAGLRAGFEQPRWSIYLDARNLADETYIASSSVTGQANADSRLFEPGDGMAIFAGLGLRW